MQRREFLHISYMERIDFMSKPANTQTKILYLAKILLEETDEDHPLSTSQLIKKLAAYGITVERKALYENLETLEGFGLDVQKIKSRSNLYFVGSRILELPELKLLVDSVQSSKFITEKKSSELIHKLETLTSVHNAKLLQRQVFVSGRVKTPNEQIYYNVDAIHLAMSENKKISFKYFEWTVDKKQQFRRGGEKYIQSPLGLSWVDNNYYLIAYSEERKKIVHFRVDKMSGITVLDEAAQKPDEKFDISEYTNRTFNMFGGDSEKVSLLVHNSLVGVILDRFGKNVTMIKADNEHFIAEVNINESPAFMGWLLSFGDKMKVLSPQKIIDNIKDLTETIAKMY